VIDVKVGERTPALRGHWRLDIYEGDVVRDAAGRITNRLVEVIEGENTVTTTGKGLMLDRLFAMAGTPAAVNSMGVGATAAASAVTDTQLGSTPTIIALDSLPTRSGLVVTAIATFGTAQALISWNELALFNGTVNGTSVCFARIAPIGPFVKAASPPISITVTVTITAT
jgi:hypothetical protein